MPARTVSRNGVDLHVIDEGPADGPVVVLAHGFPELSYSWRHQIPALASAGYRVIVPDQRGYGRSSRPDAIEDYDIFHLTGDLLAILDDLSAPEAVFVGHDWGAIVVWQLALMAPDRVRGVVGMSVPFTPRPSGPPTEIWKAIFGDQFFYMLYFQEPGPADTELGADPARTMRRLLANGSVRGDGSGSALGGDDADLGFVDRMPEPAQLPDWLTQEELDHYASEFSRTGFTGGINWYRNFDRNWEMTPHLADARVQVPSFFIGGRDDPVLLMRPPESQDEWLTDHRGTVLIDGAGHWVQQEAAEPVNDALLGFLRELDG